MTYPELHFCLPGLRDCYKLYPDFSIVLPWILSLLSSHQKPGEEKPQSVGLTSLLFPFFRAQTTQVLDARAGPHLNFFLSSSRDCQKLSQLLSLRFYPLCGFSGTQSMPPNWHMSWGETHSVECWGHINELPFFLGSWPLKSWFSKLISDVLK